MEVSSSHNITFHTRLVGAMALAQRAEQASPAPFAGGQTKKHHPEASDGRGHSGQPGIIALPLAMH